MDSSLRRHTRGPRWSAGCLALPMLLFKSWTTHRQVNREFFRSRSTNDVTCGNPLRSHLMADALDESLEEIVAALRTVGTKKTLAAQLTNLWNVTGSQPQTTLARRLGYESASMISYWLNGTYAPRNREKYEELLRLLMDGRASEAASDAVVAAFQEAVGRVRDADTERKRSNPPSRKAGKVAALEPLREEEPDDQDLRLVEPQPAPSSEHDTRELDTRMSKRMPRGRIGGLRSWSRRQVAVGTAVIACSAAAVFYLALPDDAVPRDHRSTSGPTDAAETAKAPVGAVKPHPSATSARVEWTYPDGSHKAVVDNAPAAAQAGQDSWITVNDRQPDRHWAGVVFVLYGEPMPLSLEAWGHRHIDYNGANNGDVAQDGRPGVYPAKDIYAARICEGVGSDLDPDSCSEWRYLDRA